MVGHKNEHARRYLRYEFIAFLPWGEPVGGDLLLIFFNTVIVKDSEHSVKE